MWRRSTAIRAAMALGGICDARHGEAENHFTDGNMKPIMTAIYTGEVSSQILMSIAMPITEAVMMMSP